MKNNQLGFGMSVVLLVFLISGVVIGAGYFVYKNTSKPYESQKLGDQPANKPLPNLTNANQEKWTRYENETIGIAFLYPSDWQLHDQDLQDVQVFQISIERPDVQRDESGGISLLKKGAAFYVDVRPNSDNPTTPEAYAEYFQNPDNVTYESNVQLTTIGKNKLVTYDCGHHNPHYCADIVDEQRIISFSYEYPKGETYWDNRNIEIDRFNHLLESIELY